MEDFDKMIGKQYIAQWLWVTGYGRLYGQTITINNITPKKMANITINLPDGKKIGKRVKLHKLGGDGFKIDSIKKFDVEIQCYHNI